MADIAPESHVGSFSFRRGAGPHVHCRLLSDGAWWSSDPRVRDYLSLAYDPFANASPARGPFGRQVLELAAEAFGTQAEPPEGGWPAHDPNWIY